MPATYHDLDWPQPINWAHRQLYGLRAWWMVLPAYRGGLKLRNLMTTRTYDGSFVNMTGAAWVGGKRPNGYSALTFVGASQHRVRIGTGVVTTYPITLCTWGRGGGTSLCLCRSDSDDNWYRIVFNTTQAYLDQNSNDGVGFTTLSGGTITSDRWYHICGVFASQTSRKLYLNGTLVGTSTTNPGSSPTGVNRTSIGALDRPSIAGVFTGEIDDARIYSRALRDDEIAAIYRESLAGYPTMLRRRRPVAKAGAAAGISRRDLLLLGCGA